MTKFSVIWVPDAVLRGSFRSGEGSIWELSYYSLRHTLGIGMHFHPNGRKPMLPIHWRYPKFQVTETKESNSTGLWTTFPHHPVCFHYILGGIQRSCGKFTFFPPYEVGFSSFFFFPFLTIPKIYGCQIIILYCTMGYSIRPVPWEKGQDALLKFILLKRDFWKFKYKQKYFSHHRGGNVKWNQR